MFQTIAAALPKQEGYPDRAIALSTLSAVRDGTLYDALPYEFHDERNAAGEYVPLRQRKPSVRYGLCRLVVDDSITFLFGEGRWPAVECDDRVTQDALQLVIAESRLSEAMAAAALEGSVGSVAVLFRVLKKRVFWTVMPTATLTPRWRPDEPDALLDLTERRRVRGQQLRDTGYAVDDKDLGVTFWWQRRWTDAEETWFVPQPTSETKAMVRDDERSVPHGLGFVPAVWVKNLPGSATGDENDGGCTFRAAIETSIEIDYQLSQAGRGLKYSSDPTLHIKEPAAAEEGEIVRSSSEALVISEKGDAKLLEISGSASAAVIEYVRTLREMALESVHGNRANADRISAAQSGRAMELLYAPLIGLADRLRVPYGDAVLRLARMIVRAQVKYPLTAYGDPVPDLVSNKRLTLRWPRYFEPTDHDRQAEATTLGSLRKDGMISQETAAKRTAATWDVGDATAELARIKVDEVAADARAKARGDLIQDRQSLPA